MFRFYRMAMNKYPFMTQCLTSGCLTALGDGICQVAIQRRENFDSKECFRFFCLGSVFIAPVARTWYIALDRIIKRGSKLIAVKKMLLDQACFAPPFVASILGLLRVLDGNDWKTITESVKRDYKRVLIANWQVWSVAQLINFYFMPLNYQVVFVNVVSLAWNTYIAYVAEGKRIQPLKEEH